MKTIILLFALAGASFAADFFPRENGFAGLNVLETEWGKPVYQSQGWEKIGPVAQFKKGDYALTVLTNKWDEMPIFARLQRTDGRPLGGEKFDEWVKDAIMRDLSEGELLSTQNDGTKVYRLGSRYAKIYPSGTKIDLWLIEWDARYGSKPPEVVQPMIRNAPVK